MAARKKGEEKATKAKKTRVPRKRKTDKKPQATAVKKVEEEDPNEPLPAKSLRGKLLWEYRALYAEWKVAYAEGRLTSEKYKREVTDADGNVKPKYKELLDLLSLDRACAEEVRQRGMALTAVQVQIAERLGLEHADFVKNYTVDINTGAVKYIGIE